MKSIAKRWGVALCSTPVGIEEAGMLPEAINYLCWSLCSTPVGIEEAGIAAAEKETPK